MKIKFKKIKLHHFLSFGDAEINLENAGYTLVSGVNNNPLDAAKSNGSGKSTIWSAICYALTGETIQGLKSDLANIYTNDGCHVELTFDVDGKEYILLRSKDDSVYKTNLKIFIDGEDKSGKGIKESQALLKEYLPDLTSNLLASVIILGQGLPHKFSDNTPSGRKETLEKLSKSDFMIQDIKERIGKRIDELELEIRKLQDISLINKTNLENYKFNLTSAKNSLDNLTDIEEIEKLEIKFKNDYDEVLSKLEVLKDEEKEYDTQLKELTSKLFERYNERDEIISAMEKKRKEYLQNYNNEKFELGVNKSKTEAQIDSLKRELRKLKSISDVCPTCGQKLIGVEKPDTTDIENQIKTLEMEVENITKLIDDLDCSNGQDKLKYEENVNQCKLDYEEDTKTLNEETNKLKMNLSEVEEKIKTLNDESAHLYKEMLKYVEMKKIYNETKEKYENEIKQLQEKIKDVEEQIEINANNLENLQEHQDVINKMNTLIKRDFRGYLLTNVIDFINLKSKEYCKYVFETDNVEIKLDGNDISISYCNKSYENLSGGEKQKIDLIVQFAIRDMLCQYLDFNSNLLVLDEIFDNLDSIGCAKILNLISEKLCDVESIFIITHHQDDLAIPYDYQLIVTKNENGLSEALQK